MAAITKAAMRAIKFYKHVVQSVEKFILKCKPEYKVPGLYVIDSIVRQSRHQYGSDKDVFAPRFARNVKETFANLFRCAPEDKSRIIRVLNLWQKNSVFAPEVIQPIFDLADPNHPIYQLPPPGSGGTSTDMPVSSNGLIKNSMNTSSHASCSGLTGGNMTEDKMGAGLPDLSCLSHEMASTSEHMGQCHKRHCTSSSGVAITTTTKMHSCHKTHCCNYDNDDNITGGSCTDATSLLEKKKKHFEPPCCSNYSKIPHDYCCHDMLHESRHHKNHNEEINENNHRNDCFILGGGGGVGNVNKKKFSVDDINVSTTPSSSTNILDVIKNYLNIYFLFLSLTRLL